MSEPLDPTAAAAPTGGPALERSGTAVDLILELARRLRRHGVDTSPWQISPHQGRALGMIRRRCADPQHPGVRISDLAAALRIAPRSATEVVDALEAAGLVQRAPDPRDRRAVLVSPTETGRAVAEQIAAARRAAASSILASLTAPEQRALETLLGRLVDHLDQPAQ